MSNSVVAAAAVSRAKHVAGTKKIKKRAEDQRPTQEEQAAVVHHDDSANVVQADAVASHAAMADGSMSGDFSFVSALEGAASASASLGFAQDDAADTSGDGPGGGGTLLAIGAIGLAGLGVAVAVGGGGGKKNEAPTAAATQSVETNEDTAKVITVSATDPNGDPLTFTNTAPANGTVVAGANGTFTYTPKADWSGTDTFTVTVKDPDGATATQTITVKVNPVNDAPRPDANNSSAVTTPENNPVKITVSFTDPEDGKTGITAPVVVAQGAHGTFDPATLTYTPNAGFSGTDEFSYKVSDKDGASVTQVVKVTVSGVNDAPEAAATQTVATEANKALVVNVGATDPDGDALTYTVDPAHKPAHGEVTIGADGKITYTPTTDYNGADKFTIVVSDGHLTTTQEVTVNVGQVGPEQIVVDGLGNPGSDTGAVFVEGADTGAVVFVDDVTKAQSVAIEHFGDDDSIKFVGLDSKSDILFGTGSGSNVPGAVADANDLIISYRDGNIYNSIILKDVVADNAAVYNLDSAIAATGFDPNTFIVLG